MKREEFNKIPDDYIKSTIKSAIEMIEHIDTNTFGVLLARAPISTIRRDCQSILSCI